MSKAEERISSKLELIENNFSEEGFRSLRQSFYPAGSGAISTSAMICALLDKIAEDKGWNISPLPAIEDVEKNGKLLTDYDAMGHEGVIGFCEVYEYEGNQYIITDWNKEAIAEGIEEGKTIIPLSKKEWKSLKTVSTKK